MKPRFVLALLLVATNALAATPSLLDWTPLPPVPDAEGFAGSFAGVSNGRLIVAGGANFPDAKPWAGGTKQWYDKIFVLDVPDGIWREAGRLPTPAGYGAALTTADGVVFIGGGDAQGEHDRVLLLTAGANDVTITALPSLPQPCANLSGALLGRVIYVAGGVTRPDAIEAQSTFWSLDLDNLPAGWKPLETWPGPARMFAAAGAQDGSFFLVGGSGLRPGTGGVAERIWLQDAYRYTPGSGWRRIADAPAVSVAAPSPMSAIGPSTLLLIGGDDGAQLEVAPDAHQGFPKSVYAYHTITDTWRKVSEIPRGLVTTTALKWNDRIVVAGGERMPGTHSHEVWSALLLPQRKAAFGWLNYTSLCVYLGGMIFIGWYCSRGNQNTDDYFKGGGTIPWWAAGMSIFATMLSSLTFMAVPAKAYLTDWTFIWANLPILLLAPVIIGIYLPFFRRLQITTAYEYLEKRFSLPVRLYGSAAFILFQLGRQAIVLLLPALALATVSDLDVRVCILLMGALCVAYTSMGGIRAVIWTDVAQTVVLLGAGALVLILVISKTEGGISGFLEIARENNKLHAVNWTLDASTTANAFWVILVGNLFGTLVPYTSDQTVVQRYMTTSDEQLAARSIWTNALIAMPATVLFFMIGTALFVFYRAHPGGRNVEQSTDAILPGFHFAKPAGGHRRSSGRGDLCGGPIHRVEQLEQCVDGVDHGFLAAARVDHAGPEPTAGPDTDRGGWSFRDRSCAGAGGAEPEVALGRLQQPPGSCRVRFGRAVCAGHLLASGQCSRRLHRCFGQWGCSFSGSTLYQPALLPLRRRGFSHLRCRGLDG